jgi:hypothetical protein
MNERTQLAALVFQGICAGDWKFQLGEGQFWDDVAVFRAVELADKLIKQLDVITDVVVTEEKVND